MGEREIQELMVLHEKAAKQLADVAMRAINALALVGPVLTEVGSRLGAWDRILITERHELAEKVAETRRRVVEIMDGKEEE